MSKNLIATQIRQLRQSENVQQTAFVDRILEGLREALIGVSTTGDTPNVEDVRGESIPNVKDVRGDKAEASSQTKTHGSLKPARVYSEEESEESERILQLRKTELDRKKIVVAVNWKEIDKLDLEISDLEETLNYQRQYIGEHNLKKQVMKAMAEAHVVAVNFESIYRKFKAQMTKWITDKESHYWQCYLNVQSASRDEDMALLPQVRESIEFLEKFTSSINDDIKLGYKQPSCLTKSYANHVYG